jgi:prepilin-type N-terminal cleavage/methylation domain-containing protein
MDAQILIDSRADRATVWSRPNCAPTPPIHRGPVSAPRDPGAGAMPPGFTLIELMIVVLVIGILAAIAIPNFLEMQKRASEGAVKSNMHTLQMSIEDFSLLNDGTYPIAGAATCIDGRSLNQVCPTGAFPRNPYTRAASVVQWNADPGAGNKGELAINPALVTNYTVKGNGSEGTALTLTLSSGN